MNNGSINIKNNNKQDQLGWINYWYVIMSVENKMHVKTERNIYGNKIGQIFRVLIVSANICINKFERNVITIFYY